MACFLLKDLHKQSNYGFNELHYNVLRNYKKNEKLPEFKSVSVPKKAGQQCFQMTPMHFACINPDSSVLEQVLAVNGDIHMTDSQMRKPIHYAAACANSGNLKLLIDKGASLLDVATDKTTALHCAVLANRAENVKFIINLHKELVNQKDRKGYSPFGYACEKGLSDIVKIFVESGTVKLNVGIGQARNQPLMWAVINNDYELCEYLIAKKARVIGANKFKETNLILAV